jgi:DNA modification methylase
MRLFNTDNLNLLTTLSDEFELVDLIYADCIYESGDLNWAMKCLPLLKPNGIFIIQTDYHTVTEYKIFLDRKLTFVNWLIYKQEWGGVPHNRFPQKHDDILVYCNGTNWKWYGDRIQIPKVTAGTAFDKKGTGLKTPCSVFDDLGNFSTISNERIKTEDGHNIQWQKPMKLMDRLLLPFTDVDDVILDPFMGSGTTGVWCKLNKRDFIGIELNTEVFNIAIERINNT